MVSGSLRMANLIAEKFLLRFEPGSPSRDDLFTERNHRLPHRHDKHDLLAEILVYGDHVRIHFIKVAFVDLPQTFFGGCVVVHLWRIDVFRRRPLRAVRVVARLVIVERQPELHHGEAEIGMVRKTEFGELLDTRVGQINRRRHQHIDVARRQLGRHGLPANMLRDP